MAALAVPAMIAGTVLSAGATLAGGQAAEDAGKYQAAQYRRNASNARGSAQRAAIEERRNATLAESRARAVAAASGASASDKTSTDIMAGIAEEGEYRALSALYEGEEAARGMQDAAAAAEYEGEAAKRASRIGAAGTILSSGSSLLGKYGGTGGQDGLLKNTAYVKRM